MSYSLLKNDDFPLSTDKNYRKAIIGLYHLAFVKNNHDVVIALEDKDSILEAIYFYNLMLKKGFRSFPLHTSNTVKEVSISNYSVLKEIIGLPELVNNKIDFSKDIISQLSFVDNLRELKVYAYKNMYDTLHMKWFVDDFKCYLLKRGIFFLQDETIPFINGEDNLLPVLIDEEKISDDIKELISDVSSLKLYIDYCSDIDISLTELKKYDKFSFVERLDYFVNNLYIEKVANLNPTIDFKEKYAHILRIYFSCIINHLYDDYLTNVLKIENNKKSIMSDVKYEDYFVISSLNTEIFSKDKKNYFLPSHNKKLLIDLYNQNKHLNNALKIFSSMHLPYVLYNSFVEYYKKDKENPFSHFKYLNINPIDLYSTIKRDFGFYIFLPSHPLHKKLFFLRELKMHGFYYSSYEELALQLDSDVNIKVDVSKTKILLKEFFNGKPKFSLSPYIFFKNVAPLDYNLSSLLHDLELLDELSKNNALLFFYTHLEKTTLKDAILKMMKEFNIKENLTRHWIFFGFIVAVPYTIIKSHFLKTVISSNNSLIIDTIQSYHKNDETYEIALPYKYVSYSRLAYSFREKYDSTPYFCSCQKKAIENSINYYDKQFTISKPSFLSHLKRNNKNTLVEKNKFILNNISLPSYVLDTLNLKKDLFLQLKFKDNLCHLCNHVEPSYFEENNVSSKFINNTIYETYIHAIGCEHDIFTDTVIKNEEFMQSLEDNIMSLNNKPLIPYNFKEVPSILKPYFNLDGLETAAFLINFFTIGLGYKDFDDAMLDLASLTKLDIQDSFFKGSNNEHYYLFHNTNVFPQLKYAYDIIALAYKIELAKKRIPHLDEQICLNIDYSPRLPLPYVYLGKVFNAYGSNEEGDDFYFCSCDKKAIISSLNYVNKRIMIYTGRNSSLQMITAMTLVGLPFVAVKKFAHYTNLNDIISALKFKDIICRRCNNVNHSAYFNSFLKTLPYKDEMKADYSFAKNALAKGLVFLYDDVDLASIKYSPDHIYNLDSSYDPLYFPMYIPEKNDDDKPNILYSFSSMSKEVLENYLFEFTAISKKKKIDLIQMSQLILKNFDIDKTILYRLLKGFSDFDDATLRSFLDRNMPSIAHGEDKIDDVTYQNIFGFITFLVEKFIEELVLDEKRIGRD